MPHLWEPDPDAFSGYLETLPSAEVPVQVPEKIAWLDRYIEALEVFGAAKDAKDDKAISKAIDDCNSVCDQAAAEFLFGLRQAITINPMCLHDLLEKMKQPPNGKR